ncbi:unnamed protein product [Aphanomyces euteiches]
MGPNTYKIDIPSHPDKTVTVNADRLKPFHGYYSCPYNDDIPEDDDPLVELTEDCLPRFGFVERIKFPDGDIAYASVSSPVFRILDKRRHSSSNEGEYLVEYVDGTKYWTKASKLQAYNSCVDDFENQHRMEQGLPPMHRSKRFSELDVEPKTLVQF